MDGWKAGKMDIDTAFGVLFLFLYFHIFISISIYFDFFVLVFRVSTLYSSPHSSPDDVFMPIIFLQRVPFKMRLPSS